MSLPPLSRILLAKPPLSSSNVASSPPVRNIIWTKTGVDVGWKWLKQERKTPQGRRVGLQIHYFLPPVSLSVKLLWWESNLHCKILTTGAGQEGERGLARQRRGPRLNLKRLVSFSVSLSYSQVCERGDSNTIWKRFLFFVRQNKPRLFVNCMCFFVSLIFATYLTYFTGVTFNKPTSSPR